MNCEVLEVYVVEQYYKCNSLTFIDPSQCNRCTNLRTKLIVLILHFFSFECYGVYKWNRKCSECRKKKSHLHL